MKFRTYLRSNHIYSRQGFANYLGLETIGLGLIYADRPEYFSILVDGMKWKKIEESDRKFFCESFEKVGKVESKAYGNLKNIMADNYYSGSIEDLCKICSVYDFRTILNRIENKPNLIQAVFDGLKWRKLTEIQREFLEYKFSGEISVKINSIEFNADGGTTVTVIDHNGKKRVLS